MKAKLLGVAALIASSIILSTPAKANTATYTVSGVFYPIIENCPSCSSLDLSGTITVDQTTTTALVTAVDLVAGGLPAFSIMNINSYSIITPDHFFDSTTIFADGPFGRMSLQIHPALASNVFTAAIYTGAIFGDPAIIEYYALGSLGYLKTPDGSASAPGPVVGAGLPGLLAAGAAFLAWKRRKTRLS